jgi:hypothetical protein
MKTCTWEGCASPAVTPQIASDGEEWANLCAEHAQKFDAELLDAKKVLGDWVKAQGGAKEVVKRMKPAIDTSVRLAQALTSRKWKR